MIFDKLLTTGTRVELYTKKDIEELQEFIRNSGQSIDPNEITSLHEIITRGRFPVYIALSPDVIFDYDIENISPWLSGLLYDYKSLITSKLNEENNFTGPFTSIGDLAGSVYNFKAPQVSCYFYNH